MYPIGVLNLSDLLHVCVSPLATPLHVPAPPTIVATAVVTNTDSITNNTNQSTQANQVSFQHNIIILCHGFSPERGPNYLFLVLLKNYFLSLGFTVIEPDFRDTYRYGAFRGRSERVNTVLAELLVANSTYSSTPGRRNIILVGHSQGGAAVAQACMSTRVVQSGNIRGFG